MFTPDDSLVFGGNFIHSYNIPRQIKISEIEHNTKVNDSAGYTYNVVQLLLLGSFERCDLNG